MPSPPVRQRLEALLEDARAQGFLGPGPVGPHIDHALSMTQMAGDAPARFVDLGSGAGVPGLVAALVWPEAHAVLVEAQHRKAEALERAVHQLALGQCRVLRARAEAVGRDPDHREQYDLVLARAFAGPATTAECAAPLLRVGGSVIVADPPEHDTERWPSAGLADLGLGEAERRHRDGVTVAVIAKVALTDERWPRRTGIPGKRPLWSPRRPE